ncbi:MAG: hypothetical protein KGL41_01750 [Actinomycetales bacterium]|nr:hypothetical protein [Actinomycetales bacterium]
MSDLHNDGGHGDSVAAWTSVTIIMIAFATGTAGVWFANNALIWGSVVLAAVGLVLGPVLSKLGYGVNGSKSKK